jgi:hypothetical protein
MQSISQKLWHNFSEIHFQISHEIRYVVIPIPRVMAGLLSIDVFKISTYIG